MAENKQGSGKTIDKEYLKKLAEKIKAEKAKKEAVTAPEQPSKKSENKPPKPPVPPKPELLDDDDDNDEMSAEKTAIIDLASLSGQSSDARLIITDGKDQGKTIDISRDEILVGRGLDNDFVISDISVSRKHFKVVRENNAFKVVDMGSGNGIRVNGKKIPTAVLYDGDMISAGARTIKFEITNDNLKEQFSRKSDKPSQDMVVKQKSSPILYVILLLVLSIAAAGYYFISQQQKQLAEVQKAPSVSLDDIDKFDTFMEDKKLGDAEKLLYALMSKAPDSKMLKEKQKIITKEKVYANHFDTAKALLMEKEKLLSDKKTKEAAQKEAEAVKHLKKIDTDSIFYSDVETLIGKDKVVSWQLDEIKAHIANKQPDKAIKMLSSILLENPTHEEAKKIQSTLITTVGAKKVEDIKKKVEQKKVKRKRAIAKRRKRIAQRRARARARAKAKKRAASKKAAAEKDPFSSSSDPFAAKNDFSEKDINEAIEFYINKDFSSAISKLEDVANNSKGNLLKSAKRTLILIKKFDKYYSSAQQEGDYKTKKKLLIKSIKIDKRLTKGRMRDHLVTLIKEAKIDGSKKSFDIDKAKKLYMEGRALKDTDPGQAESKFRQVLEITPDDHKYHKKALKMLKKL